MLTKINVTYFSNFVMLITYYHGSNPEKFVFLAPLFQKISPINFQRCLKPACDKTSHFARTFAVMGGMNFSLLFKTGTVKSVFFFTFKYHP